MISVVGFPHCIYFLSYILFQCTKFTLNPLVTITDLVLHKRKQKL